MAIYSYGFSPSSENREEHFDLLFENMELIISYAEEIIQRKDYFFCEVPFAFCSWLYVGGDGPLSLGHLLLAWTNGFLVTACSECGTAAFIYFFGGSPLSGSNSWAGYCPGCDNRVRGRFAPRDFIENLRFASHVRSTFPFEIRKWEEFQGVVFSWGGIGLQPARKRRLVVRRQSDPVSLRTLLNEISSNRLRNSPRPEEFGPRGEFTLKLGKKNEPNVLFRKSSTL